MAAKEQTQSWKLGEEGPPVRAPASVGGNGHLWYKKGHRNLVGAVTQQDFLSAEVRERLPGTTWQRTGSDLHWPQQAAGVCSLETEGPEALG